MADINDFCNCQPDTTLCCEAQTDLLSVSVYSLVAALKQQGGTDFTNIEDLKTEFREHASYLSDTKGAAYATQLAMCLAKGVGVEPVLTYSEAKAAAKEIQSAFSVRQLVLLQGLLTWLLLDNCLCSRQ